MEALSDVFLHAIKSTQVYSFALYMYVCVSGGKKCSFFGKFGVLCFLETVVLRFAVLPYYGPYFSFLGTDFSFFRQKKKIYPEITLCLVCLCN